MVNRNDSIGVSPDVILSCARDDLQKKAPERALVVDPSDPSLHHRDRGRDLLA